jgi:hypothetical protein
MWAISFALNPVESLGLSTFPKHRNMTGFSHRSLTGLSLNSHWTLTGLSLNSHRTLTELSPDSHRTLTGVLLESCWTEQVPRLADVPLGNPVSDLRRSDRSTGGLRPVVVPELSAGHIESSRDQRFPQEVLERRDPADISRE